MTHPLDTYPLDFSESDVQDVRTALINAYDSPDALKDLLRQSGVRTGSINLARAVDYVWTDALAVARKQDKLRVLLSTAARDPNAAAIRPLLDALVAGTSTDSTDSTDSADTSDAAGPDALAWKVNPADETGLERVIESESTLLDISFLERGLEVAASVCKLVVVHGGKRFHGTAFHIGMGTLLTNHHVLYAGGTPASSVEAWFGYEQSFDGGERVHTVVPCDPASIVGSADHDWAVVRASDALPDDARPLPPTGPLPEELDRVYIVQHPNGEVKKIGMVHNVVTAVTDDVLQYRTDTAGGSSGSPVFDESWRVVGLHHRWGSTTRAGRTEYYNQGRRVDRVVAGLEAKGVGTPWVS
ncbi:trypsin-like peptidase domain-containing protein [Terracoccus sp. 273MFTsu3.1]|uniref:trypsin-like peptidase domain-containing protein n=1 Tax=Terracoccus sp. 273MFTsu3.1 TaxID=1172188 RepID=UPI000377A0DE|nr:trypsin-like peptidase domain-containing protein [Terracoccus sp. 273MFTsu3.1]